MGAANDNEEKPYVPRGPHPGNELGSDPNFSTVVYQGEEITLDAAFKIVEALQNAKKEAGI